VTSGSAEAPRPRIEPLSVDRYGFHFTGGSRLKEKFERARALLSHELPTGEMAALFELALDALLGDREKRRFSVGRKPRRPALPHSPGERSPELAAQVLVETGVAPSKASSKGKRSRHIPAAVVREVYARDQGRCCFVSAEGRRCNSRVFLEIDHIQPFAAGGAAAVENLRLSCRAHNQWHALRYFGRARIKTALSRVGAAKVRTKIEETARDTQELQGSGDHRHSPPARPER
jgi:hypothetical protein